MTILYDFIFLVFTLLYLPHFLIKGKFHKGIWQRFGFLPNVQRPTSNIQHPIWLHAVSVGEIAALKTFWGWLRGEFPSNRIIVSTVTKTGNELAKRFAKRDELVFYLPLDFSFIIGNVLKKLKPKALIIAETEIWPNLIVACYRNKIPVVFVNGRISNKAFSRYRLVTVFLRHILEKIDFICARGGEDRKRFISLGVPSKNIRVTGNMKYCSIEGLDRGAEEIKKALSIKATDLIFTAGSTHKGEEEIVIDVFKRLLKDFPSLRLIIAPRHIERAGQVRRLARNLPATVIDKIGVLQDAYSISDIVFVGGSMVPRGGHNIIEPARFGKPTLFGPHMFNFQDIACEFLKDGAAILVKDRGELELNCRRLLQDGQERAKIGENAKRAVLKNQGAVENCIYEVKRVLENA